MAADLRLTTPAYQVVHLVCTLMLCRAAVEKCLRKRCGTLPDCFRALLMRPFELNFTGGQQKRAWTIQGLLEKMKICFWPIGCTMKFLSLVHPRVKSIEKLEVEAAPKLSSHVRPTDRTTKAQAKVLEEWPGDVFTNCCPEETSVLVSVFLPENYISQTKRGYPQVT